MFLHNVSKIIDLLIFLLNSLFDTFKAGRINSVKNKYLFIIFFSLYVYLRLEQRYMFFELLSDSIFHIEVDGQYVL